MANQNQGQQGSGRSGTHNRGFASMSESDQREIARMGGTAVSENREHMAAIGRKGGEASAEARAANRQAARAEQGQRQGSITATSARREENRRDGSAGSTNSSEAASAKGDHPELR